MKSEITLLAVAGRGGAFGASGPWPSAPALRWHRSSAASQPIPIPAISRKVRRDVSIDIDKLIHVEKQQAQSRKRVARQKVQCDLAFLRGGRPSEREFPAGVHRCLGTVAGHFL